jgi:hypothetical protein
MMLSMTLFDYLYKHPWAGWSVIALGVFAIIWWLNKPVTWADHEGSVTKDTENVLLAYGSMTGGIWGLRWLTEWWARREK